MKESNSNNLCSHGGDMLAYLYNEMAAADRDSFELHLADCGTCIDDFADLSQSRYPVFEWKQLEFDPLPTPRIVIPTTEASRVSWFDKLKASFAFRPAYALGGVAAIALVGTLVAFVFLNRSSGDFEIAEAEPTPTPARSTVAAAKPAEPVVVEDGPIVESREAVKPVKVAATTKPAKAPVKPKSTPVRRSAPLPALSTLDDDEDDSLRLSDMFEEIGTSE